MNRDTIGGSRAARRSRPSPAARRAKTATRTPPPAPARSTATNARGGMPLRRRCRPDTGGDADEQRQRHDERDVGEDRAGGGEPELRRERHRQREHADRREFEDAGDQPLHRVGDALRDAEHGVAALGRHAREREPEEHREQNHRQHRPVGCRLERRSAERGRRTIARSAALRRAAAAGVAAGRSAQRHRRCLIDLDPREHRRGDRDGDDAAVASSAIATTHARAPARPSAPEERQRPDARDEHRRDQRNRPSSESG